MTFQSRELKQTASARLQNAPKQKEIILLYSAITLGVSCLSLVLQALVSSQISNTGGLANMGSRSFLSAIVNFLPVVSMLVSLCLGFGYTGGMLRISRGQYASRNALKTGIERFWPLVRLKLLQGAILTAVGIGSSYLATLIFLASPLSDSFTATLEPLVSGGSLLSGTGATLQLDDSTIGALYGAAAPLIVIFLIVGAAFAVPMLYKYRMADFVLLDHPGAGAMYAMRESRMMMRGSRFGLFRLDLSFWWYYVLSLLANILAYGDVLLPMLGLTLPFGDTFAYFFFYALSLGANFALLYCVYNKLNVTYALAYNQLKPKEEPSGGAVLGNIFQM